MAVYYLKVPIQKPLEDKIHLQGLFMASSRVHVV